MKKYKLTIVPYLNKERSLEISPDEKVYSLYFRITYMRQTTLIRSISEKRYAVLNLEDEEINKEIGELESLLFCLTEDSDIPFNLNRIKDKYLLSQHTILHAMDTIFRTVVRENISKINDPILVTLNVGEYSPEYPHDLLVNAINDFYPQYAQKILENCIVYFKMTNDWHEISPQYHLAEPRIINYLTLLTKQWPNKKIIKEIEFKEEMKVSYAEFHKMLFLLASQYVKLTNN